MLNVDMTPNRLGFKVTGDYDTLDELYDAVMELTVADDDLETTRTPGTRDEQIMSTRLLALCYDIRHAYQGDRGIELVDSGMTENLAEWHHLPYVEKNAVFSFNVLYPEAMYQLMALNYLIDRRKRMIDKKTSSYVPHAQESMLDPTICTVRSYQSRLMKGLRAVASKGRFSRIRDYAYAGYYSMSRVYGQWIDVINCDYALMTPKKRLEELSTVVRDIAECAYHDQYQDMVEKINERALSLGCSREDIIVPIQNFPENPDW